jgi:hypothetical protein
MVPQVEETATSYYGKFTYYVAFDRCRTAANQLLTQDAILQKRLKWEINGIVKRTEISKAPYLPNRAIFQSPSCRNSEVNFDDAAAPGAV